VWSLAQRNLAVFLAVAESLSFSRSAERLHMSVSAVSRTVRRLEEEVGQPLLDRDRRRVRLTAAGREFCDYARDTLAAWERLKLRLGGHGALTGEVSLFCSVTASHTVLAPVLRAFRAAHPAVEIMLHTGDQADGLERVLTGRNDVAVSGKPGSLPARLAFLPLLDSPLELWAPAAECAVRDKVFGERALEAGVDWGSVPFIVPERGATKAVFDAWLSRRRIRPRVYAQVAGHEAIAAMVGLGLGVGVAPRLVVQAGGMRGSVEAVPLADALPLLSIGLCCLRRRLDSPPVRALWDVAGQTWTEQL